ncbi:MBT domain-containing protein 1 isoform X2 [Lepeophtheirus salmonis]|uniref:MBT domain-containing protein 1 isoform X2 n=1 Tax=Lepeophtheirus salmonis TaxID=72036 RepID=UPI001AE2AF38|nr:MBT domain-containing protein 1-like isoform X2 [Lepeophtheirus salmonis]
MMDEYESMEEDPPPPSAPPSGNEEEEPELMLQDEESKNNMGESESSASEREDTPFKLDNNNSRSDSENGTSNNINNNMNNNHGNGLGLSYPIEDYTPPSFSSSHDLKNTHSWEVTLAEPEFVAAPVSSFKHAPMSDCWDNIIIGMKVEVENKDSDSLPGVFSHAFWVATVLRISGYHALLRFEGFGQDGTKDFWISLCSEKVHPVGWCATKGKPLIPPKTIQTKYSDWKEFLVKRLTGARTLPSNFYCKVTESVSSNFRPGMKLEVVDKMRICQVRVATIKEVVGRRLHLEYDDVEHDDRSFWCHEESPLIHPIGWALKVGHQIVASKDYYDRCAMENYEPEDCTSDLFPEYRLPPGNFNVGMKLEAVDPINLATICVATVMKVLRFGYIMIRMDGYENDATGSDWFCYHASSPLIFPPGFCDRHEIKLKLPSEEEKFNWFDYLRETRSVSAPVSLFCRRDEGCKHGFKSGMKVECADQMDPRLICVSTITKVVGRLLKVHFDGWEQEYDQWMDCEAVDMYPVGWCELVGHKLEAPRLSPAPVKEKKRKPVGRKGKKRTAIANSNGSANSTSPLPNGRKSRKTTSVSPTNMEGDNNKSRTCSPVIAPSPPSISNEQHLEQQQQQEQQHHSVSEDPPSNENNYDSKKEEEDVVVEDEEEGEGEEEEEEVVENARLEEEVAPEMEVEEDEEPVKFEKEIIEESQTQQRLKYIPRLVDSAGQAAIQRGRDANLDPNSWNVDEVAQFLEINECSTLVEAFTEKGVDGSQFLGLTKDEIMTLVNFKIGPCLKVENLLQLLRTRLNPAQARFVATMRKSTL